MTKKNELTIMVIDTETTGLDLEKDRVIEVGAQKVLLDLDTMEARLHGDANWVLINPGMPIRPDASAVHRITNKFLEDAGAIPYTEAPAWVTEGYLTGVDLLCAHNAAFDRPMIERLTGTSVLPWICTYRLARRKYPDTEYGYKNLSLCYQLGIDLPEGDAHRAGFDAACTARLLVKMLSDTKMTLPSKIEDAAAEFARISAAPIKLARMPFGKHRGEKFEALPADYVQWLKGKRFDDEDLNYTIWRL